MTSGAISPEGGGRSLERRFRALRQRGRLFHLLTGTVAAGILGLVAAFVVTFSRVSYGTVERLGVGFLYGRAWDPVHNVYGALPAITGTLLTSAVALLLAVPVALGVAVFLSELAPAWLKEPLAIVVDVSAAVPSVVYGFWGLIVVVPIMKLHIEPALARTTAGTLLFSGTPIGQDVLTASVVLAIMVLPTISAISRASLQAVPRIQREAALSLGATRAESTWMAVLAPARLGIAGAIVLGLGRALGETMAVTMTIGNKNSGLPTSLFSQGQTIASLIANDINSAFPTEVSALVALGLVLLLVTLGVNVGARLLVWRVTRAPSAEESARAQRRRRALVARMGRHAGLGMDAEKANDPAAGAEGNGLATAAVWRRHVDSTQPLHRARRRWFNRAVAVACVGCTFLAVAPLGGVLWSASLRGGAALLRPSFYTGELPPACTPGGPVACSIGGIGPAIQGTLVLLALASAVAIPVGILAGAYLSEYGRGRRLGTAVSFFADVMTGFPSILLGLFVFVLFLRLDPNFTFSAVSGGMALALLMIPIVARTTEEALRAVPNEVREAAIALGFPKHRTTLRVVLGTARVGLLTGVLLAVARAGGETAALIMTAFNSGVWFTRLGQPVAALPLYIYQYGLFDYPNWQEDAWGAALVLLLIMLTISLAARLILGRRALRGET